jgi:invasion protein IalB
MTHSRHTLFCAVAILTAPWSAVHAQAPHPAQRPAQPAQQQPAPTARAPQNEEPQQTTATYGDWVLQCVTSSSSPATQNCDMAQVSQLQGKNVPFSRVAITHPDKGATVQLIVQVPVNASFATPVHIQTDDTDSGLSAPFSNCTPGGCFAIIDVKEEVLKKFREAHSVGKMAFADAGGHAVAVPLSFNGFEAALDALLKK